MIERLRKAYSHLSPRLERLRSVERRVAITGLVMTASVLLLVVGLVSIVLAMNDDNADLPQEGSLEQILGEHQRVSDGDRDLQGPAPVRMAIPRIFVDAPVETLGLDSDSYPEVPDAGDKVAWYAFSVPPGLGSNAVFAGHVDWFYWGGRPGPGVFYKLRELEIGDEISLKLEDGRDLTYRVTGNVATAYDDPNVVRVMDGTSEDVITLVTCGGTWIKDFSDPNGGNYSHRVIVRAERVRDLAARDEPEGPVQY
jgi:LPXTG-site transpeptidase (sortase) family protein